MLIVKFLLKFIRVLNAAATPRAIAGGLCLGAVAGITPTASLHNLPVLLLALMLNVNFSSAMLGWGLFSVFSYIGDPLFNKIGLALLTAPGLKPLWTALYNTPVVPWTKFNNTLTLGSLAFALAAFWPLFFFFIWAVKKYRERVLAVVQKWKITQALKASKLWGLYQEYS